MTADALSSRSPMRILVADDDKMFAELLAGLVIAAGHEVVAVETGGGLAVLQSYRRHCPDCVLLDVMMPKFNGFTIAQHLRSSNPEARIVMMSGLVEEDYPSAKHCRPNAWLPKPIQFADLQAALDQFAA
jgi:CheY-like chemotaxis protein